MQFTRTDDLFRVVRITGPTHNLLGLRFGQRSGELELEELELPGPGCLSKDEVSREVRAGVAAECQASDRKHLHVRHIQFVASDSGPVSIYRDLARAIIRHYDSEISAQVEKPAGRMPIRAGRRRALAADGPKVLTAQKSS